MQNLTRCGTRLRPREVWGSKWNNSFLVLSPLPSNVGKYLQDTEPRGTLPAKVIDMRSEGEMSIEGGTENFVVYQNGELPSRRPTGSEWDRWLSKVKRAECDLVSEVGKDLFLAHVATSEAWSIKIADAVL